MSVNKVILVGRLGQKPELRYTPSGQAVANFSLATSERWMDKSGEKQDKTEWHKIVVWGKLAENCTQFLDKGREAYIEGSVHTRDWEDKDGQKKSTTEIRAQVIQFLGGLGQSQAKEETRPLAPAVESGKQSGYLARSVEEDDLPF